MRVCHEVADFVSAPIGSCVLRANHVVWCAAPDLQGATIWGRLDEASLRDMLDAGRHQLHPAVAPRRRLLVDCSTVTDVDADAMVALSSLARDRVDLWAGAIEKQAVIVPAGLPGVLVGGALPSLGASHPLRFVHDLPAALAYLEHPLAARSHAAVAHLAQAQHGDSVLLAQLRTHLRHDPRAATLATAAGALRMSTRTLQRELARLDTSFSDELRHVRVGAAESLLVHSDLKIEAIAARVGFGNASRMSATLRRDRNLTASGLRARSRSEPS